MNEEETLGQNLFKDPPCNSGDGLNIKPSLKREPRISKEIRPGRWGTIYHIIDAYGSEISLQQKDALKIARQIIKEEGKSK